MISGSFIDEAMGELAKTEGQENRHKKLKVVNASKDVLEILKMIFGDCRPFDFRSADAKN